MKKLNIVNIQGDLIEKFVDGDITFGIISTERTSGNIDKVPFRTKSCDFEIGTKIRLVGNVQTENVRDAAGVNHKKIFVYGIVMSVEDNNFRNEVEFNGTLVRKEELRTTPAGKTIIDAVIAINNNGKSYYPAVILWGSVARFVSMLEIGTNVNVQGRFQSREYTKNGECRTAYEISAQGIGVIE